MSVAGKAVFAQFTKVQSIHRGFYKWKTINDNQKMFIPQLAIGNWFKNFSSRICQSLYDVKAKAQSERCVPYCAIVS